MLFENKHKYNVDDLIETFLQNQRKGVANTFSLNEADSLELQGIIDARAKNKKYPDVKYLQPDDLRFGTHHEVAAWRAKRLACDTLVEVGAGIGMQTIAFANVCKKVVAIELDHRKALYLRENLKALNITNVTIIEGDCMKVLDRVPAADVVFLDPERPAQEDARDLSANFSPPLHPFIQAYSDIAPGIAIELPPHAQKIDIEGEHEYMSVEGELRRLTVYLGTLRKAARSAVVLPGAFTLSGESGPLPAPAELQKYLFEVDEAVVRAGLVHLLGVPLYSSEKSVLCTGPTDIGGHFFRNRFEIVDSCANNVGHIKTVLAKANAGKVILRASVTPGNYWFERAKYEKGLTGTEQVHLFLIGQTAIVCKKLR